MRDIHRNQPSPSAAARYSLRLAAIVLLLGLLPAGSYALEASSDNSGNPQSLFNRGIFLMEEQNYPAALEVFREVESRGYAAGPLFFNMALSYSYLDSLGKASYYFQKSAQFRETRHRAESGMEFIETEMRNRGTFIPYLPWYAFIDWFLFGMNRGWWVFWSLFLINTGVMALLAGWLFFPTGGTASEQASGKMPFGTDTTRRWLARAGGFAAITGCLLLLTTVSIHWAAQGYRQAVVVSDSVPLYQEPRPGEPAGHTVTYREERSRNGSNENRQPELAGESRGARTDTSANTLPEVSASSETGENEVVDLAYEAYTVTLHVRSGGRYDGWSYIRLRNGITGWVPDSALQIL
ncbi:tetratricopeptide repeat protein [Balneolales bacterium ANBcel1]|nr:tetratricopeptide repeat protein [Balneolales bacterium ANBcel1]